jgi:NAD/NADP transhydrogenase alpha subunit
VICTALVPGRPAPRLISEEMLDRMRPGSVVVDLVLLVQLVYQVAVEQVEQVA